MSDNKDLRAGRDRQRIDPNEAFEVRYAAEQFDVSEDEIMHVIKADGDNREKVQTYLRERTNN